MLSEKLTRLISLLPDKPGVYQMKDENDAIIYIGKAKNLKKRVSQYFLRPQEGKVAAMVSHVDHFDFIIVSSEKEAFILEMNMIQTHYPRYNIMLMDDSHYPYLALKRHGDPLLKIARNTKDPKYFYFGPFPDASSCYSMIDLLNKVYPTRKCKNIPSKACIYYSMGQCLAPCIHSIEKEKFDSLYSEIKRFLGGDTSEAKAMLKKRMGEAVERLDYESAAEYKKSLDAIDYVTSKQNVETPTDTTSRDVIAYAEREGYRSLAILTYRRGLLLGKNTHVVASFGSAEEQIPELLLQYYSNHETPKELVTRLPSVQEELEPVFDLDVVIPKEGRLLDMIAMADLNARQSLDAHFLTARLEDDNLALLENLGQLLQIKTPFRIELFDNSHLQGSSPVGAMVCYINGAPAKKMYRKFHLKEEDAGDDYHSMVEVVSRRYGRLKEENLSFPDLILTDGGLAQVHAAKEGLALAKAEGIPVFGLFKNAKHQTEGLIDENGEIYPLDSKSPLFFLLMRMQDEVHRFAISFHRSLRSKAMKNSLFDGIEGIGAKRKELLHSRYPTIDALLSASLEELSQFIPLESAKSLYEKLHNGEKVA
ncbi:MAG: excinuclease ABC subunit UvrC [Candidatus Enteromonas sp.]|nr:excinuclease ABC subunit UvrC [Candidatus Enteromonas sp.]MDY6094339.1 excinuclease ABC subunit UvrC [Candidatus Enteromonas sp.]